jgi:uncharacterized protein
MFTLPTLRRALALAGVALLVIAGLATSAAPVLAQTPEVDPSGRSTVRVSGESKITAKPDVAEVDLGVVTQGKTAAAAGTENAAKLEHVMAGLKKILGANADVKTVAYMAVPNYTDPPKGGAPRIDSYTVTNVVRARVRDVKGVGKVIDQALQLGVNEVQRVAFMLADEQPVQNEALRAAAAKARAQANTLAAALGMKVVRVLNVTENGPMSPPVFFAEARSKAGASAATTPIEPGLIEVRASVMVTFEVR